MVIKRFLLTQDYHGKPGETIFNLWYSDAAPSYGYMSEDGQTVWNHVAPNELLNMIDSGLIVILSGEGVRVFNNYTQFKGSGILSYSEPVTLLDQNHTWPNAIECMADNE